MVCSDGPVLVQISSPLTERTPIAACVADQANIFIDSMGLAMTNLERRQTPRTTIARHAYINIEPNNGGIVLNVSDGGLCFHSFDPVQRNGKIRFWFSDHNRRIEASGALAWMDETQKGGLRFTALPADAHEQIRNWMSQPGVKFAAGVVSTSKGPQPGASLAPTAIPTATHTATPTAVPAARPAETKVVPVSPQAPPSPALKAPVQEPRAPRHLSGFSRGLATGLLISAVVVAAFLFQSYRREFGESLIHLGEQFAAKPQIQTPVVAAASPAVSPGPTAPLATSLVVVQSPPRFAKTPPQPKPAPRSEKLRAQPEKVVPQPRPGANKPQESKVALPGPTTTTTLAAAAVVPASVTATPAPKLSVAASTTPSPSLTSPATSLPTAASSSNPVPAKVALVPKVEPAKPPEVQTESSTAENTASTSELYFEVGKFKNQSRAHIELDKLAQLGFPATAVQKGFLWSNSYHVLVGPYGDEDRARTTHQSLVSNGFNPRPFERGSRAFTLNSPVTLNGARTPPGDYIVSWESYLDDARVKFLHNDFLVATANGRWVKRDVKFPRDAYVYRRNADGSRTLLEIRFGGTRQTLVFAKSF
jgi:hypothetical protein